jgi:hypothetical protein
MSVVGKKEKISVPFVIMGLDKEVIYFNSEHKYNSAINIKYKNVPKLYDADLTLGKFQELINKTFGEIIDVYLAKPSYPERGKFQKPGFAYPQKINSVDVRDFETKTLKNFLNNPINLNNSNSNNSNSNNNKSNYNSSTYNSSNFNNSNNIKSNNGKSNSKYSDLDLVFEIKIYEGLTTPDDIAKLLKETGEKISKTEEKYKSFKPSAKELDDKVQRLRKELEIVAEDAHKARMKEAPIYRELELLKFKAGQTKKVLERIKLMGGANKKTRRRRKRV